MCDNKYKLASKIKDSDNNSSINIVSLNELHNMLNDMRESSYVLQHKLKILKKNRKKYDNSWTYYFDGIKDFFTTNPFTYLKKEDYIMLPVIWIGSYSIVYLYRNWNNLL